MEHWAQTFFELSLIILLNYRALTDTLITPLSERAEDWRRGSCATGALSREHARECKRARAELRRRATDAQRHARKARRAPPDAKRRADVCMQVNIKNKV